VPNNLLNLFGLNFPLPWGEGWLKASGLKSAVNTPLLAAAGFILYICVACDRFALR